MAEYKSGAALARWRAGKNITQAELARRLGFSQSYLSDVETGRKPVSVELLAALDVQRLLAPEVSLELNRAGAEDQGWRCWR